MPKPYGPLHIKAVFTFTISMRIHQRIKKKSKMEYLHGYHSVPHLLPEDLPGTWHVEVVCCLLMSGLKFVLMSLSLLMTNHNYNTLELFLSFHEQKVLFIQVHAMKHHTYWTNKFSNF